MARKKRWPGFEGNRAAGGRCGAQAVCEWCGATYTVRVPWQKFCRYRCRYENFLALKIRCRYENFLALKIASWMRKAIIHEKFRRLERKRGTEDGKKKTVAGI